MAVNRRDFLGGSAGVAALATVGRDRGPTLCASARQRGLVYGSSTSTWQLSDHAYSKLFAGQAAILFTEDDLLWYRIRPSPRSGLKFARPDRIVRAACRAGQLVFGAHLVWDQGFGPGWAGRRLWTLPRRQARALLYGTIEATVRRYRGRVSAWSCANEVIAASFTAHDHGLRTDVPWYQTCGRAYVADAFHVAHEADPSARLVLNDFGHETVDPSGNLPTHKRRATLEVLDWLLAEGAPVHGVGLQSHLYAYRFAERFDATAYMRFVHELTERGLEVMITELDVLDDGLPADLRARDRAVAEVYRRFLDTALSAADVSMVMTFGLSDRYSWLQQDDPRADGAPRRPLPFDRRLQHKPAYYALRHSLLTAHPRRP